MSKTSAAIAGMRDKFIAEAEASAAEVDAGGPLYVAKDEHAYLLARAAGKTARQPRQVRRTRKR